MRGRNNPNPETTPDVKSNHSGRFLELAQNATKYWGTIYGTTGEKIGAAFVGENDDASVVVPRLTTAPSLNMWSRRRVFIGQVQDSWGLSNYTIRDVVNDPRFDDGMGKGKGKAKERDSSMRIYVGKKPPRFTARPPPTLLDSAPFDQSHTPPPLTQDGDLSDLTPVSSPLRGDWPEPAVGQTAHFGYDPIPISTLKEDTDDVVLPELRLSPGRMELAIALGLGALVVPN
jgi:hypothetical protein